MVDNKTSFWDFDVKIINKWNLSEVLLFAGIFASLLWSVYFSFVTLLIPYQIELHEGTAQVQTWFFLRGENPFVLENQPLGMNNYGMGYSLAVLPFAALFGNTLLVHRSVTFGFIVLCALTGFFVVYRARKDVLFALACAAFIVVGLIARGGIGAFPAAMGTFLFLAAMLIPFVRSFDMSSLILSVLISLAAFYTKPYFVLSFGIVDSYLFFFVSKRKGIVYGGSFIAAFAALFLVVRSIFPAYFIDTILGNVSNSSIRFGHLVDQLIELFFNFYPITIFLFAAILTGSWGKDSQVPYRRKIMKKMNFFGWDRPLIDRSVGYVFYSFVCAFMAFVFILGGHIGNYMNYAYHLIVPLFFCWVFCEVVSRNKMKFFLALAVILNLFVWGGKLLNPDMLKQNDSEEWGELFGYVRSSEHILNSPTVVSEVVALGLTPMDSGQTVFFYNVEPYPDNLLTTIPFDALRVDGFQYERMTDRLIEKQRFDLIVTMKGKRSFYTHELVEDSYSLVSEITVDMPLVGEHWTMLVWKPSVE